jgi:hypothetical protein
MRSSSYVFLVTVSIAVAACGGGSGRSPAAPSGIGVSGPSSAVTSANAAISWSCFTRAAGTGTFGTSDCPSVRTPVAPLRPATAGAINAPGAPTNFSATVTGSTVVLNWTAPAGGDAPTSYSVQAGSTNGSSDLANFDTGSTATSLTVLNVPSGTYFVRIRANNSAGQGGPSNEFQVVVGTTTSCVTISAPTGLTSTVTSTTVVLNWTAPTGCAPTTYIIQAGSTPGASNLANFSTGSTATTFTATGVAAGTYYVRVAAAIPGTLSASSNEITLTVGPSQPQTVFASFQMFDPATTGGAVTECRLRAPNNSSRLTCELRASAFTLGTATISSYSWLVRYTHGTLVEISRADGNPNLSFSDVCDAPDGVNGGSDDGVAQPLSVQLQVTNSVGASVTVAAGVDQQPPLVIRLWNCGK